MGDSKVLKKDVLLKEAKKLRDKELKRVTPFNGFGLTSGDTSKYDAITKTYEDQLKKVQAQRDGTAGFDEYQKILDSWKTPATKGNSGDKTVHTSSVKVPEMYNPNTTIGAAMGSRTKGMVQDAYNKDPKGFMKELNALPTEQQKVVSKYFIPKTEDKKVISKGSSTTSVDPYQNIKDTAVKDYKASENNPNLSEIQAAIKQLSDRAKYAAGSVGEVSANALIGLDNIGTYVGNQFRPRNAQNKYITLPEGHNRFVKTGDVISDFITGNTKKQIESRKKVAEQFKNKPINLINSNEGIVKAGITKAAEQLSKQRNIPYKLALKYLKDVQNNALKHDLTSNPIWSNIR